MDRDNRHAGHLPERRLSRRGFVRLCAALGAGFTASSFLAACGGSAGVDPGGGEPVSGGPEAGEGEAIARASAVKPDAGVAFTDAVSGEQAVLLRSADGLIHAYSAVCTHQGCIVAYDAKEGTLECPCHDSIFDPENGAEVVSGPAQRPLPEIPVRIEDGMVVRA